jgi:hypothetical protein
MLAAHLRSVFVLLVVVFSLCSNLMRFFDLMRGALRAAPTSDEPVNRMPLDNETDTQQHAETDPARQ